MLTTTALGMMVLAAVLSGAAFAIAYEGVWWHGALAVVLTLVNVGVIGSILTVKRAILGGLARGVRDQNLGQKAALLVFKPDGPLGRVAERIPFVEAEQRLRSAVESVLGQKAQEKGFRASIARSIQARLLRSIEQVTLKRFHTDAAEHGGVALAQVGAEIGERVNQLVFDHVRGMANKLTAMMVLASSGIAVVVAIALRQLPG
ncbi:MAG TPA: hypothetical protein VIG99_24315 [Myxococcaceae bacterium]